MIASIAGFVALSALATAHGDHGQSQLAGPHQGLWYNTLPGDGGTQVNDPFELNSRETISLNELGRLRILRDLNFRPPALLPMSGQRRRKIRHRIPRSVNTGRSTARSYKSPIHTSTKQVPPSIPEPPTDPAPGSDPAVSDKALAASICSTYQPYKAEMLSHGTTEAHENWPSVVATMCLCRRTRLLAICGSWIVAMFLLHRMFTLRREIKRQETNPHIDTTTLGQSGRSKKDTTVS